MKMNKSLVARYLFVIVTVQTLAGCAGETPAAKVTQNIRISLDSVEKSMPEISKAAELIAERWINGGVIYLDGTKEWTTEMSYRAGGLSQLKILSKNSNVKKCDPRSVVLAGCLYGPGNPDTEWAGRIRLALAGQSLVVLVAPADRAPMNTETFSKSERENFVRIWPQGGTPDLNAASLGTSWALVGEIVDACTRRGKMPTMLKSVLLEGARQRNSAIDGKMFHEDISVPPIEVGTLGRAYVQNVRRWLTDFTAQNAGKIEQIASHISTQKKAGKGVVAAATGHIWLAPPWVVSAEGVKELHKASPKAIARELTPGGTLVVIGYRRLFLGRKRTGMTQAVRKADGWVVGFATRPELPDDLAARSILIPTGWPDTDAVVDVPGYDCRVLPITGIGQMAIYRMIAESLIGR